MKTKNIALIVLSLVIPFLLGVTSCKKDNAGVKSVLLTVKSTVAKKASGTGLEITLLNGSLTVASANVNIANVKIEENSGDENQQGENNTGGNDKKGSSSDKEGSSSEADSGDIALPGPFALEISAGTSSLGQVNVYPGTFKKVNFQFQTIAINPFNGNTIVITGNYKKADGTIIPFLLQSNFSEEVQLLIANGGIVAAANTSQNILIQFNLNEWLNLDFAGAQVTNNQILINSANNISLLNAFNANVAKNIEADNENK